MTKDFFSMTRRERRGTIVVLVAIMVILAATWAWKHTSRTTPDVAVQAVEIQEFEAQTDSFQSSITKPKQKPRKTEKKKRDTHRKKPQRPPQPKSPSSPRRVDPVPQF